MSKDEISLLEDLQVTATKRLGRIRRTDIEEGDNALRRCDALNFILPSLSRVTEQVFLQPFRSRIGHEHLRTQAWPESSQRYRSDLEAQLLGR